VIAGFQHAMAPVGIVASLLVAGLLVAAGCAKLVRPDPTAGALCAGGPVTRCRAVARAIGLVEIAVGLWAIVLPSRASGAAVAGAYLAFAGFVAFLLLRRPDASSCGCAGAREIPPSGIHLVANLVAAGVGVAAALAPPPAIGPVVASLGWFSVPFAVGLIAAGALAVVAVTDLPGAVTSYHRPTGHPVERDADRHMRADAALEAAGIGPGHSSLWPGATLREEAHA
jgi:hypothetical protein